MDILKDWVVANFGVTALVFIALLILAIYVGSWIAKLKKDIENKPCADHKASIDYQWQKLEKDSALLHKMEGKLDNLNRIESGIDRLTGIVQIMAAGTALPSSQNPLTQSHSPISLTPMGKEIANDLGLESALSKNWDKISSIIADEKNPYDIQTEFILGFIKDHDKYLDEESINKIKEDAYKRGLPLVDYLRMLGIMSRDRYFEEHGIDVNDVDKNDPSKI